jgi:predicted nuclease of predicted toxin-antitoxin system
MKILLDECITKKLKIYLSEFEIFTVSELGISGLKNGKLMTFCNDNNYDILLTIDKNLMYQQNLDNYNVTIVVLNTKTSIINDIAQYIPNFIEQLPTFEKSKAYIIEK